MTSIIRAIQICIGAAAEPERAVVMYVYETASFQPHSLTVIQIIGINVYISDINSDTFRKWLYTANKDCVSYIVAPTSDC